MQLSCEVPSHGLLLDLRLFLLSRSYPPTKVLFRYQVSEAPSLFARFTQTFVQQRRYLRFQEKPKKKLAAMMAQRMMCAGCGMKVGSFSCFWRMLCD